YVDTDGDDVKDALLVPTGVADADGDEYYVAVRLTDLGGRRLLPDHEAPTDARGPIEESYGPGDGLWLYYADGPVRTGRFYEEAQAEGVDTEDRELRSMYTTYNCFRPLLRHPEQTDDGAPDYQRLPLANRESLNDLEVREKLYERLCDAAGVERLSQAEQDVLRRQIAHFVANLWSYVAPGQLWSYAFDYGAIEGEPDGDKVVYGLTEQLVITEAYAYYWEQTDQDGNQIGKGEAYAIELYNPSDSPVLPDQWNYKFGDINSDGQDFPDVSMRLNPGERTVIYAFEGDIPDTSAGGDPTSQEAERSDFGFKNQGLHDRVYWYDASDNIDALRLRDGPIWIWREPEKDNDHKVPLDHIEAADINFAPSPLGGASEDEVCEIRDGIRDDDHDRRRMTVAWDPVLRAEYDTDSDDNRQDHKLGTDNDFSAADWDGEVYNGFYLYRRQLDVEDAQASLANLGEISRIYLTGPSHIEGTYEDFPHAIHRDSDDRDRGRASFLGSVNRETEMYPDVPWACLVQELIELIPPEVQSSEHSRWKVGGRVNVNTAPAQVLETLWTEKEVPGTDPTLELQEDNFEDLANAILRYRDGDRYEDDLRWENQAGDAALDIQYLRQRSPSDIPGFLTPGEVAIPVLRYADSYLQNEGIDPEDANYHEAREWFYGSISNLVSVNSDVYLANIVVQLQPKPKEGENPNFDNPRNRWRYAAIIDRSLCYGPGTLPAVRLFTEVE
ncbi:MAG: hypothetical protein ACLFVW_05630, partial [Phycisphaerae bacterium]